MESADGSALPVDIGISMYPHKRARRVSVLHCTTCLVYYCTHGCTALLLPLPLYTRVLARTRITGCCSLYMCEVLARARLQGSGYSFPAAITAAGHACTGTRARVLQQRSEHPAVGSTAAMCACVCTCTRPNFRRALYNSAAVRVY